MKHVAHWMLVVASVTIGTLAWAKDAALTADQIVDRYVAACGGVEAWKKIQTMAWTGHVEASGGAVSSVPFLMQFKRPNMTRFEIMVQNNKSARIFNGSAGWKVRTKGGSGPEVQDYNAQEVDFARDATGLDGPLMDYKAKGIRVAAQGMGDVEGHRAYHLQVTLPSGAIHQVWIDAQTFLELKYEREIRVANNVPRTVSVYYRQYQQVEGLTMPMVIETGNVASNETDKMVIERVALNPQLNDTEFAKPLAFKNRSEVSISDAPRSGNAPSGQR
jgi:outer membrane lipoprotein-sorting protein